MINNTNGSELKLVDKLGLHSSTFYPRQIYFNEVVPVKNINNNDISNNKNMNSSLLQFQSQSPKPFTFYTGGEHTTQPPTVVSSVSSNELMANISRMTNNGYPTIQAAVENIISATRIKITGDTSNSCSNSSNSSSGSNKSDGQKSPMCRTKDQESAFRRIEDVHNYSKLNRRSRQSANMYSSNSSNQDEDEEEDDDDVEGEEDDYEDEDLDYERHTLRQADKVDSALAQDILKSPQIEAKLEIKCDDEGNKTPPDHHARRPMNAFLIFCKRHRGIVKEKYKNLENRSITKILGEWWASLDANDKKAYVTLAKQNKDAFFSANPNFKWYKLPAPSLRTLNTRPGNVDRPFPVDSAEYQYEINASSVQGSTSNHTLPPNNVYSRSEMKKVSYFKFADEAQMGGLNSLMRPITSSCTSEAPQETLGETSAYGLKRKSSSGVEDQLKAKRSHLENGFSSSEDDLIPKKSTRSCKGKKYQELMNSGQIKQISPKPYKAVNCHQQPNHVEEFNKISSPQKEGNLSPSRNAQAKDIEGQYPLPDSPDSYGSANKQQFNFVPFDLEDKIRALPAQCLDMYLQRKKNTKHKKKINSKKRPPTATKTETTPSKGQPQPQPKTAQEAREQVVGSQKRKARKESITRRDINSIQNEVPVLLNSSGSINSILIGGGSVSASAVIQAANNNVTSDLLILAEVAANHTGIAQ